MRRFTPLILIGAAIFICRWAEAQTGAYTLNGGTASFGTLDENATATDESGILVYNSGNLTAGTVMVTTSGNSSDTNKSSQYGINAGILAGTSNSRGTVTITGTGSSIATTGSGANGLFATSSGSSITMPGGTITTSGDGAHGVDVTYGGAITLTDVNITTHGASASALATDFGGGAVNVTGGIISAASTAANSHSAGIYSTGVISVTGAAVSSLGDCGGVIDGANTINLTNTSLSGTVEGIKIWRTAPGSGTAYVTITGGSLTASAGDAFYVTGGAAASLTAKNGATLNTGSGVLVDVISASTATFTAAGETMGGDVTADGTSTASVILNSGSSLTGKVTGAAMTAGATTGASMTMDGASTWIVTEDSILSKISDAAGISGLTVANITGNGHNVFYDISPDANSYLAGRTYALMNGGSLMPYCGNVPGTPAAPAVADIDPWTLSGVAVTWSNVDGASGYNLLVDGATLVSGVASPYVYQPGDTSNHTYRIQAGNASCRGGWSVPATGADRDTGPASPHVRPVSKP